METEEMSDTLTLKYGRSESYNTVTCPEIGVCAKGFDRTTALCTLYKKMQLKANIILKDQNSHEDLKKVSHLILKGKNLEEFLSKHYEKVLR